MERCGAKVLFRGPPGPVADRNDTLTWSDQVCDT